MMRNGFFAAINIGASAFRMQISQFINGEEKVIETLIKPLSLGKDTFSRRYITLENAYKATDILQGFKNKLDEYQITKYYKAICTSGVREASNRYFVIDHIYRKTGIKLEIIEPSEEIYVKYLSAKNDIKDFEQLEQDGILFANVASGNVSISIVKDKTNIYSASLPYGSLRLREIFKHVQYISRYKAYKTYIKKMFFSLRGSLPNDLKLKNVVCSGSSINLLSSILDDRKGSFTKSQILQLFERVKSLSTAKIVDELGIRKDEAKVLVPTLLTYIQLMEFTGAKKVYFSKKSFPQMIARFYSGKLSSRGFIDTFRNTLQYLGERYNYDEAHSNKVKEFALKLYDELRPIHSLGAKTKYMLEAGALLHDIGYFLGGPKHHEHSYYIVKSAELPGLDKEDRHKIALLVLLHRKNVSGMMTAELDQSPVEYQLEIKKLVSILRLADSLDTSHTQHITSIELETRPGRLILHAKCRNIPYMERMAFESKRDLFTEIFGIPIELETKIDYE